MEKEEIMDSLVLLYHRRLKTLLPYQDESSTRELVKQMFDCADEIATNQEYKQPLFNSNMLADISTVLQYNPIEEDNLPQDKAIHRLALSLESYYTYILYHFWPETKKETDKPGFDRRAELGKQFIDVAPPETKGEKDNNSLIIDLQMRATQIRNEKAHFKAGYTSICDRYQLLSSYDIILAYLLYTFYYQTFAKCKKDNLKEELHESK